MNHPLRHSLGLTALLSLGLIGSGCGQESKKAAQTPATVGSAAVASLAPASTAATNELEAATSKPVRKIDPADVNVSPAVAEIVRLAESGVGDSVVLTYIDKSPNAYSLSVDEILYLYDVGLSAPVITAMLRHDAAVGAKPEVSVGAASANAAQQTAILADLAEIKQALTNEAKAAPATEAATAPLTPPAEPAPSYVNAPQQVNEFYGDLAPYGTWYDLPDYGWCWRPRAVVVNPGWRPYSDRGHWLYSDCGWYWQSDYSWGWAPFHYGRWDCHPAYGWVWTPGSVWAPAWVSWRMHDGYCGWAPLPRACGWDAHTGFTHHGVAVGVGFEFGLGISHFTFVATKDFCNRNPHPSYLSPAQAKNIYQNTTVINNYVVGNNNTIINHGVPVAQVAAASRTEIRKVEVRDQPLAAGQVVKPDRVEKSGAALVVYRPQLGNHAVNSSAPKPAVPAARTEVLAKVSPAPATQPAAAAPLSVKHTAPNQSVSSSALAAKKSAERQLSTTSSAPSATSPVTAPRPVASPTYSAQPHPFTAPPNSLTPSVAAPKTTPVPPRPNSAVPPAYHAETPKPVTMVPISSRPQPAAPPAYQQTAPLTPRAAPQPQTYSPPPAPRYSPPPARVETVRPAPSAPPAPAQIQRSQPAPAPARQESSKDKR